ncbi:MAG: sigma-54-dependent transcriptional regulator [Candidatus Sumerlaeia bacterium]
MMKPETENKQVLVIDDDDLILKSVSELLQHEGFQTLQAACGDEAIEKSKKKNFSVALVDLNLPDIYGMELIQRMKNIAPDVEIIIMTGQPSLETSIAAIDEHIFAYLCKPVPFKILTRTVRSAIERRQLSLQNRELMRQLELERNQLKEEVTAQRKAMERRLRESNQFIGESSAIERIRQQIIEVAPSDMTVLIQGESGTGKDVVARTIGDLSGRASNSFVKINCPAIPDQLLESELFGHEAGAFTDARTKKPGRFELADKGTIFLDEIGDIPPFLQAKLLQVIEHKEFFRVGGSKSIHVDSRILAATNAPLRQFMLDRSFRPDLYYRLCEYQIVMPPLRERPEDIPMLVDHFIWKYAHTAEKPNLRVSSSTIDNMLGYNWPGNIRELESTVRRFVLTGLESAIIDQINAGPRRQGISTGIHPVENGDNHKHAYVNAAEPEFSPQKATNATDMNGHSLQDAEIQQIVKALHHTNWNRKQAAEILGISYSTLRRRIREYDLKER